MIRGKRILDLTTKEARCPPGVYNSEVFHPPKNKNTRLEINYS
jgi:hypothetical protein